MSITPPVVAGTIAGERTTADNRSGSHGPAQVGSARHPVTFQVLNTTIPVQILPTAVQVWPHSLNDVL